MITILWILNVNQNHELNYILNLFFTWTIFYVIHVKNSVCQVNSSIVNVYKFQSAGRRQYPFEITYSPKFILVLKQEKNSSLCYILVKIPSVFWHDQKPFTKFSSS